MYEMGSSVTSILLGDLAVVLPYYKAIGLNYLNIKSETCQTFKIKQGIYSSNKRKKNKTLRKRLMNPTTFQKF